VCHLRGATHGTGLCATRLCAAQGLVAIFGPGVKCVPTSRSCRSDAPRLYSFHTQHDPWRAAPLAWRTRSDDNAFLGALLSFVQGEERIVGLRLGVVAQAFESETQKADNLFGPPIGRIYVKYAVGSAPEGSTRLNPWLMVRAIGMVLGWRVRGRTWPHPFFERTPPAPKFPVTTLSPAERDALRSLCGPHPSRQSSDVRSAP
jgi:hypothetical protein